MGFVKWVALVEYRINCNIFRDNLLKLLQYVAKNSEKIAKNNFQEKKRWEENTPYMELPCPWTPKVPHRDGGILLPLQKWLWFQMGQAKYSHPSDEFLMRGVHIGGASSFTGYRIQFGAEGMRGWCWEVPESNWPKSGGFLNL